mmetsp:Transcript_122161/g.346292  ORF Transcript_122161/g.346292 Transcript_122161/m.346292 type:complete len:105 (+) Transcript_122161:46-360(+)
MGARLATLALSSATLGLGCGALAVIGAPGPQGGIDTEPGAFMGVHPGWCDEGGGIMDNCCTPACIGGARPEWQAEVFVELGVQANVECGDAMDGGWCGLPCAGL